jgi:hypothetical protein
MGRDCFGDCPVRLYLDICCLQRPHDDQSQARIFLEALSVESVLRSISSGDHELLSSDVLLFENSRNPDDERRSDGSRILNTAKERIPLTDGIESRAVDWNRCGIGWLDALHLASAEAAFADRFATVDDILLKRSQRIATTLRIVGLVALCEELGL